MPQSGLARALLIFGIGLAVLVVGVASWLWTQSGTGVLRPVISSGVASVGGPFELVDQRGQTRRDEEFRGRFMLVYFGYTFCPDVCPTSLLVMSQALDAVAATDPALAEQVVPIFITIDPERDTVPAMRDYAPHFHERLVALTGSAEQVAKAAKGYRVFYAKAAVEGDDGDYLMDHSTFVYLMDREGRYLSHFAHNAAAEEIAEVLKARLGS